jgi:hypothetical protein
MHSGNANFHKSHGLTYEVSLIIIIIIIIIIINTNCNWAYARWQCYINNEQYINNVHKQ